VVQLLDFWRIEKPKDDFLTRNSWVSGDADITTRIELGFLDPAILRKRFLVRLQAREEFDPTEEAFSQRPRDMRTRRDDAIQPKGNRGGMSEHLQMNIARVGALGLLNEAFETLRRSGFRIRTLNRWNVLHGQQPSLAIMSLLTRPNKSKIAEGSKATRADKLPLL
jgi:hypothetical protein